ncbi:MULTISPECIES: pore-forming ESAT-6 family protein [Paenibacillus]|jgi:WXG100 family type VII secretion target|uniref:ESAT-6-like protein n=1 Tax=Paenibacillus borealis TaxID=160799 RepID=A0ABX3H3V3_PAEBO|nr:MULTISPECIES: pore-forming ESAT-6 family protein [Paenibacillus]AIQ15455.1 WXG100 family type VII secretion target [Paenibacillus sp. FSL H7-0357]OMD41983.1 type VII secretion protein [Paenibacillus borealis]
MSTEGIQISLPEVANTAGTIRSINENLSARLDEIKMEMNALASTWQSDASNTIREKFKGMEPRFEEYKNVIISYATFLDTTVKGYEDTENAIKNNASQFK